ncbi:hypothetical protein CANARDRAFT_27579 [[Candida] arabinofermentans NRRL YB-2248]|uniref:NADP-dependent oxidoreductase domain-containing protein n=1 Tax=[Candida] arabinofermentans NRRL YB-2248 TaxID=983967 RepID=A0A1E4T3Q5_9ASCO|nr:hypothetical protein CANARDRAFT_27579 [[Candida] arabinofermentans NRRL YB-2248]
MKWDQVSENTYTYLGNSGLQISRVIVGCMSFGKKSWSDWVLEDEEKVFAILKRAYDLGIRTFDTADVYSNGHSEILLRKFMAKYNIKREKVVIFTKVFFPVDDETEGFSLATRASFPGHEYVNNQGLSRKHIMTAVDNSVERLGTYIDLYQIHRFDPKTPISETMEALHDCIKAGKVRYIGASTMKAYQFVMMQSVAEKNGWTKFISMQNYYNLSYREEEREMNEYCKETGVGLIPWSPNARGILTRPLTQAGGDTSRVSSDATMASLKLNSLSEADKIIINRVEEVSKKYNVSMAAVSTAYVLYKGCSPIVGFSKPERVDDAIVAINLKLSKEDVDYLEEPYQPKKLTG